MSIPAGIKKTLLWAAKRFPRSQVTMETIDAYAEELSTLDPARLELAIRSLFGKKDFFPSLKDIQDAEKGVLSENDDKQRFRKLELDLIALADEMHGGVIDRETYLLRYRKTLEASGYTSEQLERAPVYPDGHPEPDLTWQKLHWRRLSYCQQAPSPKKPASDPRPRLHRSALDIRQALAGSITPPGGIVHLPTSVKRTLDEENRSI